MLNEQVMNIAASLLCENSASYLNELDSLKTMLETEFPDSKIEKFKSDKVYVGQENGLYGLNIYFNNKYPKYRIIIEDGYVRVFFPNQRRKSVNFEVAEGLNYILDFFKKEIKQDWLNMKLDEAIQTLENAGFLVETNKRSAAFYYRAKVFEKIQQIFDERAAEARKTNPNVRGFKLDTLKSYIRAYGYQDLNKLINGEFEAGVSVKEAAEKCIDWFLDIVEREG